MKRVPITRDAALAFIARVHRHHAHRPAGHLFAMGAEVDGALVAVVMVGRPEGRLVAGLTAEVTRLAAIEGQRNACSFLYAAARRAAQALGYEKLLTYTLLDENGASLRASGWRFDGLTKGGSWSRAERRRKDKAPTWKKQRWLIPLQETG